MSQNQFFVTPLDTTLSGDRKRIMDLLEQFCTEVKEVTQGKVTCSLIPGFLTNLGTEYRATIRSQGQGSDHILFRAHVPTQGLPLYFDFYEEEMKTCDTIEKVGAALADFAQLDSTREALRLLSQ